MKKTDTQKILKQIHILSNVTFGGGERSLIELIKSYPSSTILCFIRKIRNVNLPKNTENNSFLNSKYNYSLLDQLITIFLLPLILLSILFKYRARINNETKIVLHGFPLQFFLPFFALLYKKNFIAFVYHQNKRKISFFHKVISFVERNFLLTSKINIFGVSEKSCKLLSYFLYGGRKRTKEVKLFINVVKPIVHSEDAKFFYEKLNLKKNQFLLYPARFDPSKGHLSFVDDAKVLKEKFSELKIIFAGGGTHFEKNRQIYMQHNLDNVIFLGNVEHKNLLYLYKNCYATFTCSREESYGVTFVEAYNSNKIVYSTNPDLVGYMKHIINLNEIYEDFISPDKGEAKMRRILDGFKIDASPEASFKSLI